MDYICLVPVNIMSIHSTNICWKKTTNICFWKKREPLLPHCLQSWTLVFFLPLDLNWNIGASWFSSLIAFTVDYIVSSPSFSGLWSWTGLHFWFSWVSMLLTSDRNLSASVIVWANSLNKFLHTYDIYIQIHPIISVFLENPDQ